MGNNESVITSSALPDSHLTKRHNALSYHRVREAIVAKIMNFVYKKGQENPADILSKHCAYPQLWPHIQPLLFWVGNPSHPNDNKKRSNPEGEDRDLIHDGE